MTPTRSPVGDVLDLAAAEQPIRLIMSDPPASVEQHDSLRDVAKELAAEEVGVLLVESPVGSVGIVSERDVGAVMAIGGDVEREQVKTVMSVDLVTAAPADSMAVVGRLMSTQASAWNARMISVRRCSMVIRRA